jgi:transketolase C-terminal domain/subunit
MSNLVTALQAITVQFIEAGITAAQALITCFIAVFRTVTVHTIIPTGTSSMGRAASSTAGVVTITEKSIVTGIRIRGM